MKCPHCGEEVPGEGHFCPACGKPPDPSAKVLCDGCTGAFPAGELEGTEGRFLCSLCRAREESLKSGTPGPGFARMTHTEREFKEAKGLLRPRTSILAVFSLVTLIVCPVGLVSLLLGIIALFRIRSRPRELSGTGFAVAGIILGGGLFLAVAGLSVLMIPLVRTLEQVKKTERIHAEMSRIASFEKSFHVNFGRYGTWRDLVREGYLDPVSSNVPGYDFEVEFTVDGFRVVATPKIGGPSVHYLLDEEGNFRYEDGKPAGRFSPVWKSPFPSPPPRASTAAFPAEIRGGEGVRGRIGELRDWGIEELSNP